ncbi:helix-turn-helix domain-containing protein [Candidatus Woesearchaeota archaeon]|nr:helix-turn-helix domain-containing protein [Candidatus Woesearchaeota archaeon]
MAKESFILVSLEEGKTKKLAQTISNETCRKILNFLSQKDYATESQISKELSLPISTVHYNLKALQQNGLVEVEEFHYSKKGREVDHYTLANKLIVIAPKAPSESIMNKLKKILPVALIVVVAAGLMKIAQVTQLFAAKTGQYTEEAVMLAAPQATEMASARGGADLAEKAVTETVAKAPEIVSQASHLSNEIILWFLIGAISAIAIFFIIDLFKKKQNKIKKGKKSVE